MGCVQTTGTKRGRCEDVIVRTPDWPLPIEVWGMIPDYSAPVPIIVIVVVRSRVLTLTDRCSILQFTEYSMAVVDWEWVGVKKCHMD